MHNECQQHKDKSFIFKVTESMIDRLTADWKKIAKEDLTIRYNNGFFDATGSELAILRLVAIYRYNKDAHYRADKPNLFTLDINKAFTSF